METAKLSCPIKQNDPTCPFCNLDSYPSYRDNHFTAPICKYHYHLNTCKTCQYKEQFLDEEPLHLPTDNGATFPWFWITINPKDDVEPTTFFKLIADFIQNSKYCTSAKYFYVFEQRSETTDFSGIHCHLLLERPAIPKPDNVITALRKKLMGKNCIGDNKHVHSVSIPQSLFLQKIRYMQGHKKDKQKHAKAENDRNFRAKYSLRDYYSNIEP